MSTVVTSSKPTQHGMEWGVLGPLPLPSCQILSCPSCVQQVWAPYGGVGGARHTTRDARQISGSASVHSCSPAQHGNSGE